VGAQWRRAANFDVHGKALSYLNLLRKHVSWTGEEGRRGGKEGGEGRGKREKEPESNFSTHCPYHLPTTDALKSQLKAVGYQSFAAGLKEKGGGEGGEIEIDSYSLRFRGQRSSYASACVAISFWRSGRKRKGGGKKRKERRKSNSVRTSVWPGKNEALGTTHAQRELEKRKEKRKKRERVALELHRFLC